MKRVHRIVPNLLVLSVMALTAGCDPGGKSALCSAAAYDAETGMRKDFGTAAVARHVNAFLDTAIAVTKAAREIDSELLTTCRAMATDLQIPAAELAPADSMTTATKAACTRVSNELRTVIQQNLPVNARLSIIYQPAICEIDLAVTRSCIETCEQVTITETDLQCMPGNLVGMCSAMCTGSCSGSCSAQCTGQCSGQCTGACDATCKGQCAGTCNGRCDGTCSAMDAQGNCTGTCTGTCTGSCSAQCTGTCTGTCTGSCSASCSGACGGSCQGSCRGGCSVQYTAPKCTEITRTRMETQCTQSCETESRAEASCTAPSVAVDFLVSISPAQEAKLRLAMTALRNHYGKLLKLGARTLNVVGTSAAGFYTSISGIANNIGSAGVEAGACVANALVDLRQAVDLQLSVSVEVSVSMSASATAQGMAAAGS